MRTSCHQRWDRFPKSNLSKSSSRAAGNTQNVDARSPPNASRSRNKKPQRPSTPTTVQRNQRDFASPRSSPLYAHRRACDKWNHKYSCKTSNLSIIRILNGTFLNLYPWQGSLKKGIYQSFIQLFVTFIQICACKMSSHLYSWHRAVPYDNQSS